MKEMIGRLSRLTDLKREVDDLSQRVGELELAAQGGVGRISGLPGGGRMGDRVGDYAVKLVEMRDLLEKRRLACMEELGRLYEFIDDLPDSRLRMIFTARYVDGLSWLQVAFRIGEYDEQVPRRMHNRYLRQFDEKDETKTV